MGDLRRWWHQPCLRNSEHVHDMLRIIKKNQISLLPSSVSTVSNSPCRLLVNNRKEPDQSAAI